MNIETIKKNEPKNAIPRVVDELGRVVIPIDFRRRPLNDRRILYMETIKNYIILKKEDENNVATKRELDKLGRLTIYKEIRKVLNIEPEDQLLVWTYKDMVILRKKEDKCIFCEGSKKLLKYENKFICNNCLKKIDEMKKDL